MIIKTDKSCIKTKPKQHITSLGDIKNSWKNPHCYLPAKGNSREIWPPHWSWSKLNSAKNCRENRRLDTGATETSIVFWLAAVLSAVTASPNGAPVTVRGRDDVRHSPYKHPWHLPNEEWCWQLPCWRPGQPQWAQSKPQTWARRSSPYERLPPAA